ncbi:transporter family-2 protein [Paucidesulfovibrio gracilis DSM 16080]|uniref:Transporter family-2 protein n=1 Tax=Paucidesulfovibrio gracilis DSM 16080 TaxID=1121449 RepID=A0A1T4XQJ1_9BACT|nr:transporter family-2 protein [Paucidesulfovibrio gracilis DSM 16080]
MDLGVKAAYHCRMKSMYILIAMVAGFLVPMQAGINVRLKQAVGDAAASALVSFAVGTVVLALWCVFTRPIVRDVLAARGPWWMWTGGLFGAFFVAATILLAEKVGAGAMLAWIIASQLMGGLILDHFGAFGFAVREISPIRVFGVGLLVLGAVIVQRF